MSDSELGYTLITICSWKTLACSLMGNIVHLENILSHSLAIEEDTFLKVHSDTCKFSIHSRKTYQK